MTSSLTLTPALDLFDALDEIRREQLFDPIKDNSHVQEILLQFQCSDDLRQAGRHVLDAWFARDPTGRAVGVALITDEQPLHTWHKLVNLFVHPEVRGQGVGKRLLEPVLQRHGKLHGHYTADSIGLYEALNIPDFFKHRSDFVSQRDMNERHLEMHMEHALEKTRVQPAALLETATLPMDVMNAMAGPGRSHRSSSRPNRRRRGA